ncbi:hypothetical protein D3C78_1026470 [compost metagenome]
MRATAACRAVAGRRRLDKHLVRAQLLHLVENAAVGGHDQGLVRQALRRCDQLTGGTHRVGQLDHRRWRLRVHQDGRIRVQRLHVFQLLGLELFMNDARTVPKQHVGACLALNVGAQVLVRAPDDRLAVVHQAFDDFQRATGGHDPVRSRFHRCRGVGIHHHRTLRMLVTERRELVYRAPQVQRTGRLQGRHQHAFFRIEDFRRLPHELHARHHYGLGRVCIAEAGHFQGVGNAATGFFGQGLNDRVTIEVGNQHRVLSLELGGDGTAVMGLLFGGQRLGLLGVEVGLNQKAFGNLRHVRKTCKRIRAKVEYTPGSGPIGVPPGK